MMFKLINQSKCYRVKSRWRVLSVPAARHNLFLVLRVFWEHHDSLNFSRISLMKTKTAVFFAVDFRNEQ